MSSLKQNLAEELSLILGIEIKDIDLTEPPERRMGDFCFACFSLAKEQKKAPPELAKQLSDKINVAKSKIIESAQNIGPYVNLFVDRRANKAVLISPLLPKTAKSKIMIEYSQPNTHKEFHIGHLRNACLGASLVNIYRALGNKVISANYIGDAGVHVAKCLWALLNYHKNEQYPQNKGEFLGTVYSQACALLEGREELNKEVSEIQKKLEAGDKELTELWKKTKKWSLESFYRIYALLGIKFDEWFWESEEEKEGKKMLAQILKLKAIPHIKESQGAIIADLSEFGLDVLVLIKSDGNALYGAKDLPLGIKKFKKFKIDEAIYVVDNRQSLYLKQIFKLLNLLGFADKRKTHVAYDFVTLPEGAMASLKGNVVTFESFYAEILEKALAETKKRHTDWTGVKLEKTARIIALSAIKFNMLKYENNSVIVFDVNKALSFDGDSGPYLLYTVARINSVIAKKKGVVGGVDFSLLKEPSEKELILKISQFAEAVNNSQKANEPALLAGYLIELAHKFNNFYHHCPILSVEKSLQKSRLALLSKAKDALLLGLSLLNIESVGEM